ISINQIKNFLGQLRSGLDTDHASLGATVNTQTDNTGLGRVVVNSILEDSDVYRRGLDIDDEVVTFNGIRITSANVLKNELGVYPRGWRLPMEYRRTEVRDKDKDDPEAVKGRKEILVRLMGVQRKEIGGDPNGPAPKGGPVPKIIKGPPQPPSPASKLFIAK